MKEKKPSFNLEINLSVNNQIIAGVDEVGRGCLAGPIVAAAVVFSDYEKVIQKLLEVNDSKKITENKRIELDLLIRKTALSYGIGQISVESINKIGIGAANVLAFKTALDNLKNRCNIALIDGRRFRGFTYQYICLEKGESKSLSIAAASIIAKVYRDNLMCEESKKYPAYGFDSNKGYCCKKHLDALKTVGPSPIHRKDFLKFLSNDQGSLF